MKVAEEEERRGGKREGRGKTKKVEEEEKRVRTTTIQEGPLPYERYYPGPSVGACDDGHRGKLLSKRCQYEIVKLLISLALEHID